MADLAAAEARVRDAVFVVAREADRAALAALGLAACLASEATVDALDGRDVFLADDAEPLPDEVARRTAGATFLPLGAGQTVETRLRRFPLDPRDGAEAAVLRDLWVDYALTNGRPLHFASGFPIEALPSPLADFVKSTSAALGSDAAMLGAFVLGACSAAIAGTRSVRASGTWVEPCLLWIVAVLESGGGKSPALRAAMKPLLEFDAALAANSSAERVRCAVLSDSTLEAACARLRDNPRGLAVVADELALWVGGFDAYRSGGQGRDAAAWLTTHDAGSLRVDRKGAPTILLPRAAVAVVGGMQPEVFRRLLAGQNSANGLLQRLLVVRPEWQALRFSERAVPPATARRYEEAIRELCKLGLEDGRPKELSLTPAAKAIFVEHHDRLARDSQAAEPSMRGLLAKLKAALLRIGGTLQLAVDAANGCAAEASAVGEEAMVGSSRLVEFFAREARRAHALVQVASPKVLNAVERIRRALLEAGKHGASRSELLHGALQRRWRSADLDTALALLQAEGAARRVLGDRVDAIGQPAEVWFTTQN